VQGDFYDDSSGDRIFVDTPAPPWQKMIQDGQDILGVNLLTRWQHTVSVTDSFSAQAYYDQTEWIGSPLHERRYIGDIDFQYRTQQPGNVFTQDDQNNPTHQFSLRSSWNPKADIDVGLWLRRVDRIKGNFGLASDPIPSYTQFDAQLAWRPLPKLEFSVAAFKQLDKQHPEFRSEMRDILLTGIRRSFYSQFCWEF
jgi:outer membrane receptor protein involved in Fe transport